MRVQAVYTACIIAYLYQQVSVESKKIPWRSGRLNSNERYAPFRIKDIFEERLTIQGVKYEKNNNF